MATTNVAITDLDLFNNTIFTEESESEGIANVLKLIQSLKKLSRMITIKI